MRYDCLQLKNVYWIKVCLNLGLFPNEFLGYLKVFLTSFLCIYFLLKNKDMGYRIIISCNGKKKKVSIPYDAITSFTDPSVGFGLQFKTQVSESNLNIENKEQIIEVSKRDNISKNDINNPSGEIVSLDEFRDKK